MASTKDKIAVVLGTAGLMTGALTFFQPPSSDPHQRARDQLERNVSDLSDAHEREIARKRKSGEGLGESVQADRNRPAEHRPPPEPRFRIRVIR